ncbi:hypothetical protein Sango_2731900 [Sesamum angolense]|uniref:Retrotransposon gag domain-containing protein n=1 Tax=Sesamum angolense TaxID=2727404 RepID=A0AAE1VY98_9LAMI|nr:hypothetical protein Sango_2731900 [Sesamum angolense]
MSKDIVESFMYCATSRELWMAIQARYGRSNGPMIYQLQREISSVSQQDLSLTAYLTKVTKLWNELSCLSPVPKCKCGGCTCGVNKGIADLTASTQLMQFLMGRHETFSHERSQILMLDPLLDIENAFAMKDGDKIVQRKKPIIDKRKLVCSHCRKTGHAQESCFKLHGVLDWYKTLNDKKKKGKAFAANVDIKDEGSLSAPLQNVTEMMAELLKLLQRNNTPIDPISNYANYAHFDDEFAGHASMHAIKHILALDCSDDANNIPCEICHKAKQSRIPFPVSSSHSVASFDLIHMDLWGPYAAHTIFGSTYILTLLDD